MPKKANFGLFVFLGFWGFGAILAAQHQKAIVVTQHKKVIVATPAPKKAICAANRQDQVRGGVTGIQTLDLRLAKAAL